MSNQLSDAQQRSLEEIETRLRGLSGVQQRRHMAELELRLERLEQHAGEWMDKLLETQAHLLVTNDVLLHLRERLSMLEQSAARKPGPKPKDSHG